MRIFLFIWFFANLAHAHVYKDCTELGVRVFGQTARPLDELKELFPLGALELDSLMGKKVLDIGCGLGAAVIELKKMNVEALGLDLFISPALRNFPGMFIEGDITTRTSFPARHFDLLISSFSFFSFESKGSDKIVAALKECARIMRPGAKLLIAPIDSAKLTEALQQVPELKVQADSACLKIGCVEILKDI